MSQVFLLSINKNPVFSVVFFFALVNNISFGKKKNIYIYPSSLYLVDDKYDFAFNRTNILFLMSYFKCFSGINSYVIAFTALAAGTSWPDLVASKIAAERQTTADSAIANITCRCYLKIQFQFLGLFTY